MKFLIIGLGSMGKRRIRCLKALGYNDIVGIDLREDRLKESKDKYNIKVSKDLSRIALNEFNALIISTPPKIHNEYLGLAIKENIPVFVEASVILCGLNELNILSKQNNTLIAPSCTLLFHPIIRDIKQIVLNGKYGEVTNFTYHSGNYLPDWHPWENVTDFYVSEKESGGCREIVPFELTWICDILGIPQDIKGYFSKTMEVGADIEDTYGFTLRFNNSIGSIIIDVTSRYAIRNLILNFERAQLLWRWDKKYFELYESETKRFIRYMQPEDHYAEFGYNKNIIEQMYIDELDCFIKSIQNKDVYPNTLEKDIQILQLLNQIEDSDGGFRK